MLRDISKLRANIQTLFYLTSLKLKIFLIVFTTFAILKLNKENV